MGLSLIVAVSDNNVIGKGGEIPWYIPEDLKHFKSVTMSKPVIMGRDTYESIVKALGGPLPGRKNIVLTRNPDYGADKKVYLASSLEEAMGYCDGEEGFVIGGESVYQEALPIVDTMELTCVHIDVEGGDRFFPEVDCSEWKVVDSVKNLRSPKQDIRYSFFSYGRN